MKTAAEETINEEYSSIIRSFWNIMGTGYSRAYGDRCTWSDQERCHKWWRTIMLLNIQCGHVICIKSSFIVKKSKMNAEIKGSFGSIRGEWSKAMIEIYRIDE